MTVRVFYRPDKQAWYAAFTVTVLKVAQTSSRANGALGIDVNPDHLALCLISSDGNPIAWRRIELDLTGTTAQNADRIGCAIAEAFAIAETHRVPVIVEKLDFGKARMNLRYLAPRLARLLSSFAYRKILDSIDSRALRCGIELIRVSPAWTSVLGQANYAVPYGVSVDQAAACCIARRGLGLREQVRPSIPQPALEDTGRADAWTLSQKRLILLARSLPSRSSTWGHAGLARDHSRTSAVPLAGTASVSALALQRGRSTPRQGVSLTGSSRKPRLQRPRTSAKVPAVALAHRGQLQR